MMQELLIGVNVAKDGWTFTNWVSALSRINNTPGAVDSVANAPIKKGAWVMFEASGG